MVIAVHNYGISEAVLQGDAHRCHAILIQTQYFDADMEIFLPNGNR